MISVLFRSVHMTAGGYAGGSASTQNESAALPSNNGRGATSVAAAVPTTTTAAAPVAVAAAPPPPSPAISLPRRSWAEKSPSLRAAVTAGGSRRCTRMSNNSSSSNSSHCCRNCVRSAGLLLPSLRPAYAVNRITPVALCDGGKGDTSSFFSSFKLFDRQRNNPDSINTGTADTSAADANSGISHQPAAATITAPPTDTYAAVADTSSLRSQVTDPHTGLSSEQKESSSAAAAFSQGAGSIKHTRPPSAIPIPYEQFSREWMGVSGQDNFDGFRLEATKQVNKVLTANHTFHMGTTTKEGGCSYSFGPTLVIGEPDEAAQQEGEVPKFFGMARLSSDGSLQARIIKALSKTSDIKFNSNSSLAEGAKDKAMYEICLDKVGNDWATNLKLAWQGTWIVNGLFSQVITPKLQMGGELTWVTANGLSMASVGGRYAFDENNIGSCQLGVSPDFSSPLGFATDVYSGKAQYVRKVTDRLSVGTEIECAHPDMSSSLKLGWQYLFRQARVQGTIDTAGRVAMYSQDYNGFALSGLIDYWQGDYKFGFQMNVVPPPPPADR